jgi:hypothetical protein
LAMGCDTITPLLALQKPASASRVTSLNEVDLRLTFAYDASYA